MLEIPVLIDIAYHCRDVEKCLEASVRSLILRHSFNTSLLHIHLACQTLNLCVPAIAKFEALAWNSSICVCDTCDAMSLLLAVRTARIDYSSLLNIVTVLVRHLWRKWCLVVRLHKEVYSGLAVMPMLLLMIYNELEYDTKKTRRRPASGTTKVLPIAHTHTRSGPSRVPGPAACRRAFMGPGRTDTDKTGTIPGIVRLSCKSTRARRWAAASNKPPGQEMRKPTR